MAVSTFASTMKLTATLGPFGLAFSAEPDATVTLACDPLKGRPFVTGLNVMRLTAPMGGRDAYEFRLQCGAGASPWSTLGPSPLMWTSAEQAEASCNRPQSARGLQVTRGRVDTGRQDHYGFTLVCGVDDALVELDIEGSRHVGAEEQGGRRCPEGSFLSGLEVSRAFEPHGAYDLYEFKLHCSEIRDPEEENAPSAAAAAAAGYARPRSSVKPLASGPPQRRPESVLTLSARAPPGWKGGRRGGRKLERPARPHDEVTRGEDGSRRQGRREPGQRGGGAAAPKAPSSPVPSPLCPSRCPRTAPPLPAWTV